MGICGESWSSHPEKTWYIKDEISLFKSLAPFSVLMHTEHCRFWIASSLSLNLHLPIWGAWWRRHNIRTNDKKISSDPHYIFHRSFSPRARFNPFHFFLLFFFFVIQFAKYERFDRIVCLFFAFFSHIHVCSQTTATLNCLIESLYRIMDL